METHQNNPLELFRLDEAILILVQVMEGLAKSLALKAFHQLSELIICKRAHEKTAAVSGDLHPNT